MTSLRIDQGLQRRRGGSEFIYREATGGIVVGFGSNLSNFSNQSKLGIEENGVSNAGVENVIISQALESSILPLPMHHPKSTVVRKP